MKRTPSRTIFLFFLTAVIIGTGLLMLPFSYKFEKPKPIDALFTATSAICVTGLIVKPTGEFWSLAGQLIILLLIQIGGLGYMSLAIINAILIGRVTIKERLIIKEVFDLTTFSGLFSLLKRIIKVVFLFEFLGFVVLSICFLTTGYNIRKALYNGLFHAISAFCNAGFSTFGNSLCDFNTHPFIILVMSFLIIMGGIGFLVIFELKSLKNFSLHTKIVLISSTVLIIFGFLYILIIEWSNVLKEMPLGTKLLNAFFHAVTPRTAGFNTLDVGLMLPPTLFVVMMLMFIGGSPGGTAGGIKTTTISIVLTSLINTLRGKERLNIFRRSIPKYDVFKAHTIFISSILLVFIVFVLLLLVEMRKPVELLFETISAFGTVGLSFGITGDLSSLGKLLIIVTMFTGRVGILCLGSAILLEEKVELKYPEEKVMIG